MIEKGWIIPGDGIVRHALFAEPYALSRCAGNTRMPYTLGSAWGVNGRIVALGFEGPVFVISVRER